MLLNDKLSDNSNEDIKKPDYTNNNDPFVSPKNPIKINKGHHKNMNNITTNNSFGLLSTTPISSTDFDFDNSEDNDAFSVNSISNNTESFNNNKKKYRSTTIIGGRMVKDLKAHKLKRSINKGDRIYVKPFSGATIDCMKDYVKPSLKFNPDLFILHTGANDLRSNKAAETIADDIINLTQSIKSSNNDVYISGLIERCDELNDKGLQVNDFLMEKCVENNIFFIDNSNISARKHLNGSGIHLNYSGTIQLAKNYLDCINL